MNIDEAILLTHDRLADEGDSMGDLLGHFRNRVSPVLIGDREWEQVLECAEQLPITMGALPFGFELPLHEARPQADFGASLASGTSMAADFEERARANESDALAHAIVRLFKEMDAENSMLREIVGRKLMLEFDIGSAQGIRPAQPGMFLRPSERPIAGGSGQLNDLEIVVEGLVSSTGWEGIEAQWEAIKRVYDVQPRNTRIDSFGVFPSRSRAVRLGIWGFDTLPELCSFLEKASWPGQTRIVDSIVSRYKEKANFESTGVNIDVTEDGVGPILGVTPVIKRRYTKESRYWLDDLADWDPFLEALSHEDIVVPDKLAELANWVSKPTPLFGKSGRFVFLRGIHHVKLVISENRLIKVKAYVFMVLSGAASL